MMNIFHTKLRQLCGAAIFIATQGAALYPVPGTTAENLTACHGITDPMSRLACYDGATGRDQSSTPTSPPGTPGRLTLPEPKPPGSTDTNQNESLSYEPPASDSLIDSAWAFEPNSSNHLITTHKRNYLLFARYSSAANETPYSPLYDAFGSSGDLDPVEAKFQISFKTRLWATGDRQLGLWLAYTQQSHWQIYNNENSRPFRETNYLPELLFSYRPGYTVAGFTWKLFNLGYIHQSNGKSELISRSWDRLMAEVGLERDNFGLFVRAWYRIPESDSDDENPDITDYYGYGDVTLLYRCNDHGLALKVGGNPATGKGFFDISWVTPPIIGPLRGYLQFFSGYGESLIDYNWYQNTVGFGVTLNDLY